MNGTQLENWKNFSVVCFKKSLVKISVLIVAHHLHMVVMDSCQIRKLAKVDLHFLFCVQCRGPCSLM